MDTNLIQLVATLQIADNSNSSALFGLKRLFPDAFRRAVGCNGPKGVCIGEDECPCRQTFGQELSTDPSLLRSHQKPPFPFIFDIPLLRENGGPREEIDVGLLLIGSGATSHINAYLESLCRLFKPDHSQSMKGTRLIRVEALSLDKSRTHLGDAGGRFDLSAIPVTGFDELLAAPYGERHDITIEFNTPVRLMTGGRLIRDIPFPSLAGALFRRISSLASYYGGIELTHDFKWLAQQCREIKCSSSELSWVNWGGGVQGIIGKVSYSGDLARLTPFIKLGELLHVGKGASYGMGRYEIRE